MPAPAGKAKRPPKSAAAVADSDRKDARWLMKLGWRPSVLRPGWRHPSLGYPWPAKDALRLEEERAEGRVDAVGILGEPPAAK